MDSASSDSRRAQDELFKAQHDLRQSHLEVWSHAKEHMFQYAGKQLLTFVLGVVGLAVESAAG